MNNICYIFLKFIIYAFIGWVTEVGYALLKDKRLINRGFLIGPYCPIYGVGIVAITTVLKKFMAYPLALFILAMVICMTLEYVTSFVMEKLFDARWWDYSSQRFNINGRICLETAIPFGLGGLFIMYVVNPFVEGILGKLAIKTMIIISISLFIIFLIDLIISLIVILKVNKVDISKYKDDTEIINKKVKEYLSKYSILTKRLIRSFPDAKLHFKKLKDKIIKRKKKSN